MIAKCVFTAFLICLYSLLISQRSAAFGGSAQIQQNSVCVTDAQRAEIEQYLKANIAQLREEGFIQAPSHQAVVLFDFPMAWSPGFEDYGFHSITNFVDQDPNYPGMLLDYGCGGRTYDTESGYNHRGIDYVLWPFAWQMVEANAVQAVAGAPGTIVGKSDGNQHFNCSFSSDNWNAVYVMHADGSVAWYGHLKMNSLTTKEVGETVEAGEYLGIIASSGNSTAPHLHFEVHDAGNNLIDPNAGTCNDLNNETWWSDQRPYYDPQLNRIQTHFAPPEFNTCPELETTNAADIFAPGETVYFAVYLKDQRNTDQLQLSIFMPNGLPFDLWNFSSPELFYSASYWYWYNTLPVNAMEGTWRFRCNFAGTVYVHEFEVTSDISSTKEVQNQKQFDVFADEQNITLLKRNQIPWKGTLAVYDISGKEIQEAVVNLGANDEMFDIRRPACPGGVYAVCLFDERKNIVLTERIILVGG